MDIIYGFIMYLLSNIYSYVGDLGITIIILTSLVKMLLLPLSIKQKIAFKKQQDLFKKIEEIKVKYKDKKDTLESEIAKLSKESSKSILGFFIPILQLPIMYSLYNVVTKMPIETTSILIPWLSSLKLPDPYYIVPIFSIVVQLMPNIITSIGLLKTFQNQKISVGQIIITSVLGFVFLAKAPVVLGIYWISSNLFNFFEQLGYQYFSKKYLLKTY